MVRSQIVKFSLVEFCKEQLGPLLFILYITDLPNCLSNSVARMYAEDTHLTFASNNIETINDVMNHDLSNVNKWLTANKLTLNSSKTEFKLLGSRQRLDTCYAFPKPSNHRW